MTIEVHFYSIAKDLAETSIRRMAISEQATLATMLDQLFAEVPALEKIRKTCLFAIGTNYAPTHETLKEGDVISIIPPMQGG